MQFETNWQLELKERAADLSERYGGLPPETVLEKVLSEDFAGRVGLVSSFGTEAAVLLHMIAQLDPDTPVIFLDTLKHFPQTLGYRDDLVVQLGLRNVVVRTPRDAALQADDPRGDLHATNPDLCCHVRKTLPMMHALQGLGCWVTGRKRYQADTRKDMALFEVQDRWIKVNPLLDWGREEILAYFDRHDLPRHPMEKQGYPSIGCAPCTRQVREGEDIRAGRWADSDKTECGIHFENGRMVRKSAG